MKRSLAFVVCMVACGSPEPGVRDAPSHVGDVARFDTGGGGPTALNCDAYCASIMGRCTQAHSQFATLANCKDSCANYSEGLAGDTAVDTLACRVDYVDLVASDADTNCYNAGPTGGDVCGERCGGFCVLALAKCPAQYPSAPDCPTTCGGFNPVPQYNSTIQSGNTFACRMYHATAAASDPAGHCSHIAVASSVCQ